MPFIYVTQGTAARLDKKQNLPTKIDGFYTDRFNSCNLALIVSKNGDKYSFLHLDQMECLELLKKEIEWVGKDSKIIFNIKKAGVPLNDFYSEELKDYKDLTIEKALPSENAWAIKIILSNDAPYYELKQHLTNDCSFPDDVLYHPKSRDFLFTRNVSHHLDKDKSYAKSGLVFDEGWHRLEVNNIDNLLKQCGLDKSDSPETIFSKISSIIDQHNYTKEQAQNVQQLVTYYIINMWDKDNIRLALVGFLEDEILSKPIESANEFYQRLQELMNDKLAADFIILKNVEKLIEKFSDIYKDNEEWKEVCNKIQNQMLSYIKPDVLSAHAAFTRERVVKIAEGQSGKAVQHFQKKEYSAAEELLSDSYERFMFNLSKEDPRLATVCYNYGRSLSENGKYQAADALLKQALRLRKDFSKDTAVITKTENAIKVNAEKLAVEPDISSKLDMKI